VDKEKIKKVEKGLTGMYQLGQSETLGQYITRKAIRGSVVTVMMYMVVLGYILFDSWDSVISFDVTENIDRILVAFAVMSVLACPLFLVSNWYQQFKSQKKKTGISYSAYAGLASLGGSIGFLLVLSNQRSDPGAPDVLSSYFMVLLAGAMLWGTTALVLRIYLLYKYCPYLYDYRGGKIIRPWESDNEYEDSEDTDSQTTRTVKRTRGLHKRRFERFR